MKQTNRGRQAAYVQVRRADFLNTVVHIVETSSLLEVASIEVVQTAKVAQNGVALSSHSVGGLDALDSHEPAQPGSRCRRARGLGRSAETT
jgi:hypothetical protein